MNVQNSSMSEERQQTVIATNERQRAIETAQTEAALEEALRTYGHAIEPRVVNRIKKLVPARMLRDSGTHCPQSDEG